MQTKKDVSTEAYSELYLTSKMEIFVKIIRSLKAVPYFYNTFHLRYVTGF